MAVVIEQIIRQGNRLGVACQKIALPVQQTVGHGADAQRGFQPVKADLVILGLVLVVKGQRKRRVVADAEAQLLLDGVFHRQGVVYGFAVQRKGAAQHKGIGPFGQGLGVGVQLKHQGVGGLADQRMFDIAGKAVLAAGVLHALGDHFAAGQLAGVGEQNRRVAAPDGGVCLPQQLGTGGLVDDADSLGTVGVDCQAQEFILNRILHTKFPPCKMWLTGQAAAAYPPLHRPPIKAR